MKTIAIKMNEHKNLRILQYNINHGKEATLIPLLQDENIHKYDIIAIQEPWRNPFMKTSYNPSTSLFHLAYPPFKETRVCFYVNKRLHPGKWSVTNHSEDAQTITIEIAGSAQRVIQVHNIYNPSPQSYSSTAQGTLATLRNCLQVQANNYIMMGDFNLHHPYWCGLARPTQHAAADILLDIAQESLLTLATPRGTTTWTARGSESTIDLAFISQSLENELIKCRPRHDIAQSSDHFPIEVLLRIQPQLFVSSRRRCWKKTDSEKLMKALSNTDIPNHPLENREQIDARIQEITQAVTNAIESSVPWARPSTQAKDYWSEDCVNAVKEARHLFYNYLQQGTDTAEQRYKEARNKKIATIRKYKKKYFRAQVAAATSSTEGTWKIAKWAKTKAGVPRQPPQLPQLTVKERTEDGIEITRIAKTLAEKTEAL